jgi:hypothetical protein
MMSEEGVHDFDFLHGEWHVSHRKLARRLAGSQDWLQFDGSMICRPLLGCADNFDDNVLDDPAGAYRALALRRFDRAVGTWSIWWFDSRYSVLRMDTPMRGRFDGAQGLFLNDETFEGRPIKARFLWSEIEAHSARWEQAFSVDGGATWEVNWIMRFERRGRSARAMIERRAFLASVLAAPTALEASVSLASEEQSTKGDPNALIELRQYTLHGGRRDELITLFEREFIEPQDALGAYVLGLFRDLDDPDRFVWLRGFAGMAERFDALTSFYSGPVWQAHRAAANATMVDSDNVLLFRIVGGQWPSPREEGQTSLVRFAIHYLGTVVPAAFLAFFKGSLAPAIAAAGGHVETVLLTSVERNTFTRLPVRKDEQALVWLTRFASRDEEEAFSKRLAAQSGWRDSAPAAVLPALMRKPEVLRLAPTARSRLR